MLTVVIRRDRGNALTVRNGFAVKETGTLIRGFTMRLSEFVGSGLLRQTLEKANVPPSLVEQIIRLCSRPNARLIVKAPEMQEMIIALVCCPAFNGQVFERDKESHRIWTLASALLV